MLVRLWRLVHPATVQVRGTVASEGVCAERATADARWTARVRLQPWSRPGCASTQEPLHLTLTTTPRDLRALQDAWPPGADVHALVRIRRGTLQGQLLERFRV